MMFNIGYCAVRRHAQYVIQLPLRLTINVQLINERKRE